jgi:hypothetical protein
MFARRRTQPWMKKRVKSILGHEGDSMKAELKKNTIIKATPVYK